MFNTIFPKIHKEGYKFLAISVLLTFVALFFSKLIGLLLIIITVWVYYFFRDPERFSIDDDSYLVSPADGLITDVSERSGPEELRLENTSFTRVSIFMNVFNCHVNRFPIDCKVSEVFYKPGDFVNASMDDASTNNERNLIKITSTENDEIIVTQVAGLVARRIVSYCNNTENYKQGQSFGIIRFGSRVDLFFKNNFKVLVKKGQTVVGGETLLASRIV